ncbi:MAG TPA: hypothetical protein VJR27_01810 [Candidatus Saccharimonadales bacterium]|nr:hypothetical protein [Candidatus Saccharimonadales bacterium]
MPNPDSLRQEARRLHQQAESLERHAQDVERHLRNQEQTIRNLEQNRQDWQNRLHQLEIQLSTTADPGQRQNLMGQIQDINRRLLDQDKQIQNARNEHDKLLH